MTDAGPASWAELVRDYRREKVQLSWDPAKVPKNKYVTTYEKSRAERVFDPILQSFRNPETESIRRGTERTFATAVMNKARETQLATGQPFDILNHTVKRQETTFEHAIQDTAEHRELQKIIQKRRTHVDYNVISNKPLAEHHFDHPDKRPPSESTVAPSASVARKRDYDILSNRYLNRNGLRQAKDKAAQKDRAARLFWQTHDFHPVNCTFYDRDKEDAFVKVREAFESTHGEVQQAKLPPRIRLAEGNLYNIIQPQVIKNQEEMMHYDYRNNNKFNSTKDVMERSIRKRMEDKSDLAETRKLNKVASQRFEEMTANGFDLVTGQNFFGKNAKKMYRPSHMQRPPNVMERVARTKLGTATRAAAAGVDSRSSLLQSGTVGGTARSSARSRHEPEAPADYREPTPVPEQDVAFYNVPSAREREAKGGEDTWNQTHTYKEVKAPDGVPPLALSTSASLGTLAKKGPGGGGGRGKSPGSQSGVPRTAGSERGGAVRTGGGF
jgi:hypothetical protein